MSPGIESLGKLTVLINSSSVGVIVWDILSRVDDSQDSWARAWSMFIFLNKTDTTPTHINLTRIIKFLKIVLYCNFYVRLRGRQC